MRTSLFHFAAIGIVAGSSIAITAQAPQQQALSRTQDAPLSRASEPAPVAQHVSRETTDNPVAAPGAMVVVGKARFTVLTPEMVRMEWAADGKFEDHASFVFINRRLPVPIREM